MSKSKKMLLTENASDCSCHGASPVTYGPAIEGYRRSAPFRYLDRSRARCYAQSPMNPLRMGRLTCLTLTACVIALPALAGELRVGVGTADITPPLGIPLAGYYHERGADGVLDPLLSKAIVLEVDGERAGLVVVDLIGITRWVTDQARNLITEQTGISGDHIMISATHAHTGPVWPIVASMAPNFPVTVKRPPAIPIGFQR